MGMSCLIYHFIASIAVFRGPYGMPEIETQAGHVQGLCLNCYTIILALGIIFFYINQIYVQSKVIRFVTSI